METTYCTDIYQKTRVTECCSISESTSSLVGKTSNLKIRQSEKRLDALKILMGDSNKKHRSRIRDTYEKSYSNCYNNYNISPVYSKRGEVVVEEHITVQSEYLDNSGPCTKNTSLDADIDVSEYIRKAQANNDEKLRNAGDEFSWNNSDAMQDIFEACIAAVNEKYSYLRDEALQHANPYKYIKDKYYNSESPFYASDLTEAQRNTAYSSEYRMLKYGKLTGVYFADSLFDGITIKGQAKDADENIFNRRMVNQQLSNMLDGAGITIPSDADFVCTVDATTCWISIEDQTGDGVDRSELISRIENAINKGDNGKELYIHIRQSCFTMERMISSQYSYDGWNKFNYMHFVDKSSYGMSGDYNQKYKNWCEKYYHGLFSDEAKEYGLDGIPDMNLQIGLKSDGFYDMYQDINWSNMNDETITKWYSETEYSALSDVKNTIYYTR